MSRWYHPLMLYVLTEERPEGGAVSTRFVVTTESEARCWVAAGGEDSIRNYAPAELTAVDDDGEALPVFSESFAALLESIAASS